MVYQPKKYLVITLTDVLVALVVVIVVSTAIVPRMVFGIFDSETAPARPESRETRQPDSARADHKSTNLKSIDFAASGALEDVHAEMPPSWPSKTVDVGDPHDSAKELNIDAGVKQNK